MASREALDNAARLAASPAGPASDQEGGEDGAVPPDLDPNAILIAEFEYARAAAFQANEDRARVSSYFLATVGSVLLALLGLKLDGLPRPLVALGFSALFGVLAWMGLMTINQLAALRLAWHDSCRAMNRVKAHYVARHPAHRDAFLWTDERLPGPFKATSISSQLARLVALIMGFAAGAAVLALGWAAVLVLGPSVPRPDQAAAPAVVLGLGVLAAVARAAWLHYVRRLGG